MNIDLGVSGETTTAPSIITCLHIAIAEIHVGLQAAGITIPETTYFITGDITVAMGVKLIKVVIDEIRQLNILQLI